MSSNSRNVLHKIQICCIQKVRHHSFSSTCHDATSYLFHSSCCWSHLHGIGRGIQVTILLRASYVRWLNSSPCFLTSLTCYLILFPCCSRFLGLPQGSCGQRRPECMPSSANSRRIDHLKFQAIWLKRLRSHPLESPKTKTLSQ